jgi:hypothetical protein
VFRSSFLFATVFSFPALESQKEGKSHNASNYENDKEYGHKPLQTFGAASEEREKGSGKFRTDHRDLPVEQCAAAENIQNKRNESYSCEKISEYITHNLPTSFDVPHINPSSYLGYGY